MRMNELKEIFNIFGTLGVFLLFGLKERLMNCEWSLNVVGAFIPSRKFNKTRTFVN